MIRSLAQVLLVATLCLSVVGIAPTTAAAQTRAQIREIVVEGAQRIEHGTVRSYLLVQIGDPFDAKRLDRSLKRLFSTGLFADVTFRREGATLVVAVVENPVINRIAFEGNQRIDDDALQAEVSLRPRIIYTRTKVQNDVERILTLYRRSGRFAATVEPKVIQLPQNRVDLVFEIDEGELTEIRRIRFVGNKAFDDSDLREVIRTTESRWYQFLTSDDTYDPDRLTLDRELLRRFYLNEGYADFQVRSAVAELTPDRKAFFITFTVEEGERYKFGPVTVEANLRDLQVEDVSDVVEAEEGDWYEADLVEKGIDALTTQAGNLGYAFVDVRPRLDRDPENNAIGIAFEINEGPRVFLERIDISGNSRTLDDVIRREFKLVEGDAFNVAKLRRSKTRVENLNFFESVSVERVPGSAPDKAVVKVAVEEKSTGSFAIGAGFSTTSGAVAEFSIEEKNLLGRGQTLRLRTIIAQRQSEIDLSFTQPYFLDREITAGIDVFHITTDFQDSSSFDSTRTGGSLRMGYPITEDLRQSWRYTYKRSIVENVDDDASLFIKEQEGTITHSEVTHALTYDKRDNRLFPQEGYILKMVNDLAVLGGTNKYLRNVIRGATYYPLLDEWVLELSGSAGHIVGIGDDVSLIDRFFVGGDDLRGFATSGIGPRDVSTDDALGGEWMYTGTAQVSFPIGLPADYGFKARVFSDFGSVGTLASSGPDVVDTGSIRVAVGAGFTWRSPVGPIGVDFGFPVVKESFDEVENLRINFGTRF